MFDDAMSIHFAIPFMKLYNTIGLIYVTYLLKATCQHIFPFEGIKP